FPYEEIFESLKAMHRAGLESWDNMEFMAKIRAADEEGRRKLDDINMRDVYSFKDDHLQRLESYLIISYNATNKVLDSIEAKVMRNGRRNIRRW
ncbi:MAG: hypothetical protein LBU83_07955, partial [Bacteroidales bacterium]|nr:hypothetical protein [Bacteroidales bacterium]